MKANMVAVGQVLYGYCEGYFGRDGYGDKRIESFGADWIVAREVSGKRLFFAEFDTTQEMVDCVERWSVDNEG